MVAPRRYHLNTSSSRTVWLLNVCNVLKTCFICYVRNLSSPLQNKNYVLRINGLVIKNTNTIYESIHCIIRIYLISTVDDFSFVSSLSANYLFNKSYFFT